MKKELFNPKPFHGIGILFPVGKRVLCADPPEWVKRLRALAVCLLLFPLFASTQTMTNYVIPEMSDTARGYVVFRWGADTLDNAYLKDYFLLSQTSDTAVAATNAKVITAYLLKTPQGVGYIDEILRTKLLTCSLDDYACYIHIRQKRATIVKE